MAPETRYGWRDTKHDARIQAAINTRAEKPKQHYAAFNRAAQPTSAEFRHSSAQGAITGAAVGGLGMGARQAYVIRQTKPFTRVGLAAAGVMVAGATVGGAGLGGAAGYMGTVVRGHKYSKARQMAFLENQGHRNPEEIHAGIRRANRNAQILSYPVRVVGSGIHPQIGQGAGDAVATWISINHHKKLMANRDYYESVQKFDTHRASLNYDLSRARPKTLKEHAEGVGVTAGAVGGLGAAGYYTGARTAGRVDDREYARTNLGPSGMPPNEYVRNSDGSYSPGKTPSIKGMGRKLERESYSPREAYKDLGNHAKRGVRFAGTDEGKAAGRAIYQRAISANRPAIGRAGGAAAGVGAGLVVASGLRAVTADRGRTARSQKVLSDYGIQDPKRTYLTGRSINTAGKLVGVGAAAKLGMRRPSYALAALAGGAVAGHAGQSLYMGHAYKTRSK